VIVQAKRKWPVALTFVPQVASSEARVKKGPMQKRPMNDIDGEGT
jgi:hypothetical protein